MKKFYLLLILLLLSYSAAAQTPVVVELFTSEGCSSCPPADALLVKLSHDNPAGAKLILLGEHVDYWNYIGWTDRFSSAAFSDRQNNYVKQLHLATAYTPQMVIDGHVQLVGNGADEVYRDVHKAAAEAKPAHVLLQWENGPGSKDKLHVTVQAPPSAHSKVLLAITEDGLSTAIGGGENSGRTLQHAAVVRQLRELGTVSNGQFTTSVDVPPHADWNQSKLKVAVLVQDASGRILGADSLDYQR